MSKLTETTKKKIKRFHPTIKDLAKVLFTGFVKNQYLGNKIKCGERDQFLIDKWWTDMDEQDMRKFMDATISVLTYLDDHKLLRGMK